MSKKDLRELQREFEKRGWTVSQTKGDHLKWLHPSGEIVISSQTPSDHKTKLNVRSYLLRAERKANERTQAMTASATAATVAKSAETSFTARIAHYRTGGSFGVGITMPLTSIPRELRAVPWRLAVNERHFTLYQSNYGNMLTQDSTVRVAYKTNNRRIDQWPLPGYTNSHPAEDCAAVIASDSAGRPIVRIALPGWLRKWYADDKRANEAAVVKPAPAVTQPQAEPKAPEPAPSVPPPSAFAPVGGVRSPYTWRKHPDTPEPTAPVEDAAVQPTPTPTPTPTPATAADPDRHWKDACALCDLINESLNNAPAGLEFFLVEGRLAVRRITVQEYRPK